MHPLTAPEEAKLRRSVFLRALLLALQRHGLENLAAARAWRRSDVLACALAASSFFSALWACMERAAFALGGPAAPALSVSAFACASLASAACLLASPKQIAAAWRRSQGSNPALRGADALCSNCELAFERAESSYRQALLRPRQPAAAARAVLLAAGCAAGAGALALPFCLLLLCGSCAMFAALGFKTARALARRPKLALDGARFAAQAPRMAKAAWNEACACLRAWAFESCPVPEPELAARCARKRLGRCAAAEPSRARAPKSHRQGRL